VQPLEPPRQQRQLVLSKHVKLLIWHRHQRGQREHPGRWVMLAFPFEPPTRARLWESVGPSSLAVMPLSTSADLSFENSSFTVRVSYFSNSAMASNFQPQIIRSKECKSLTALS
jgi:hypothetical protein